MKKVELSNEDIKRMIHMYCDDLIGSARIGEVFGLSGPTVRRILKENGVDIDTPGQRYKGGDKAAKKRQAEKETAEQKQNRKEYYKKWQKENREKLREYHTEWRKTSPNLKKQNCDWEKARRDNPFYRFNKYLKTALWANLKEHDVVKCRRTFDMLPYTKKELLAHIESQFDSGMTWDNYGSEWHLDHKMPLSWFNFQSTDDPAFLFCWGLDNLQPKWATTRMVDGVLKEGNLNKHNRPDNSTLPQ